MAFHQGCSIYILTVSEIALSLLVLLVFIFLLIDQPKNGILSF